MVIGSLEFVALLLLLSAVFFWIPGASARRLMLAACSVAFIAMMLPNLPSALFLVVFLLTGYGVARRLQTAPAPWMLPTYLVVLVLAFAAIQRYTLGLLNLGQPLETYGLAVVGVSYMLFRQIHFLVDAKQGQIAGASLWTYLNYQLNFLTLVAGPIQRFQDFARFWANPQLILDTRHDILKAYLRVFVGVISVVGISSLLSGWHANLNAELAALSPEAAAAKPVATLVKVMGLVYVYPVYMYFNFAGYCDIVIGGAALLGLRLPENFDKPYLARNVLDFWTKWHQSLGFWVRDYLFTPMYMALAKWNAKAAGSLAFLCYFAAFVVMGVWHGTGIGFLVFGLLHGLGGSAAKLWETWLVKTRGRKGLREYLQVRWIRVLAIAATLHYFAFTLLFFSSDLEKFMIPFRAVRHALLGH